MFVFAKLSSASVTKNEVVSNLCVVYYFKKMSCMLKVTLKFDKLRVQTRLYLFKPLYHTLPFFLSLSLLTSGWPHQTKWTCSVSWGRKSAAHETLSEIKGIISDTLFAVVFALFFNLKQTNSNKQFVILATELVHSNTLGGLVNINM